MHFTLLQLVLLFLPRPKIVEDFLLTVKRFPDTVLPDSRKRKPTAEG